jgi:hypothetical protein
MILEYIFAHELFKERNLKSNPIYLLQTRSSLNLYKTPSEKKKKKKNQSPFIIRNDPMILSLLKLQKKKRKKMVLC